MCVFCFGSGVPADCDPHPGDGRWAAGPDDPRSDRDCTGGPAETHAATSCDDSGSPAAGPWGPQPHTGASQRREPKPAAQITDESPCCPVKDTHQTSMPLARGAGSLGVGRRALHHLARAPTAEPWDSVTQEVQRLQSCGEPAEPSLPTVALWTTASSGGGQLGTRQWRSFLGHSPTAAPPEQQGWVWEPLEPASACILHITGPHGMGGEL